MRGRERRRERKETTRDEALSLGIREVVRSDITTKQQISGYIFNVKGTVTTRLTQQNSI